MKPSASRFVMYWKVAVVIDQRRTGIAKLGWIADQNVPA